MTDLEKLAQPIDPYDALVDPKQERSVPEWDGDGLPPYGLIAETKMKEQSGDVWKWHRCLVVGLTVDNHHVLHDLTDESLHFITNHEDWDFRPVRTERDRVIEAMVEVLSGAGWGVAVLDEVPAQLLNSDLFDITLKEGE